MRRDSWFDRTFKQGHREQVERAGYDAGLARQSDFGRRAYSGEARMDWLRGYQAGLRDAPKAEGER